MTISRFSRGMVVCLLAVLPNAGCIGYLAAAITPPTEWKGETIDISRISEIVVGETTREQIEAMFGRPEGDPADGHHYFYSLTRGRLTGHPIFLMSAKGEGKRLLLVMFDGDVVKEFLGSEPGAVEVLEQARKEREAADR